MAKARIARKQIQKVCLYKYCPRKGKPFVAFRETALYCGHLCRSAASRDRVRPERAEVLKLGSCSQCQGQTPRMFVRKDRTLWCSTCMTKIAQKASRKAVRKK